MSNTRTIEKDGYRRTEYFIFCLYCGAEKWAVRKIAKYCSQKCQMDYEYANNKRSGKTTSEAAHQTLRKRGHYKRDNSYLILNNPATKEGVGDKISVTKTGVRVPKLQGANHWNWRGGVDKGVWFTWEYKQWRKAVFKYDKYTCVKCGDDSGGNLEADHIKPKFLYPELMFDVNNGRTLCHDCHVKTPTYGIKVKSLIIPVR